MIVLVFLGIATLAGSILTVSRADEVIESVDQGVVLSNVDGELRRQRVAATFDPRVLDRMD